MTNDAQEVFVPKHQTDVRNKAEQVHHNTPGPMMNMWGLREFGKRA